MNAYGINESGYYPPGAEHDPRAPWNQDDDETEFEHDEFCGVNRANARRCDCQDDY